MYLYVLSYLSGLCALSFLYLLPDQKADALYRMQNWGSRPAYAKITVGVTALAWLYAVTINLLVMFPKTSFTDCWRQWLSLMKVQWCCFLNINGRIRRFFA